MDYIDRTQWPAIESGSRSQNVNLVTAGIQAAVNVAISKRKRLNGSGGAYVHGKIICNGALEFEGEGRSATEMVGAVPNVDLWVFNTDQAVRVAHMTLYGQNSSTIGSILQLNGGGAGRFNSYSHIDDVTLGESFNGIHFKNAGGWVVRDSYIVDNFGAGLLVENQASPDNGDSLVSGCVIANPPARGTGIRQLSSGGLKIIGNKGLGFKRFYDLAPATGVSTSILVATSNSVEGFTEAAFYIGSGGGYLGSVLVNSNQISIFGTGAKGIVSQVQENLSFSNNVLRVGGSNEDGIVINSGGPFTVEGNTAQVNTGNTGAFVRIGSGANNGLVGRHKSGGFGTAVVNLSSTTTVL